MATIIFYLVVAIGGMAAVWGVVHVHDGKVKAAALAPWEPLTKQCNDAKLEPAQCAEQWRTAIAANVSLQADFQKLAGERQACTDNTMQLGKDTQAAINAKNLQLASKQKQLLDLKASQDALEASLEQPAVAGETCEAILVKIDSANDDVGARRLRDYPPGSSTDKGEQPAPGANPGRDTLRLTN